MARYARVQLVLTLHTIAQHPTPLFNTVLKILDSTAAKYLIIRNADAVISVDVQMRDYIKQRFGLCQTSMIPYGIDIPDINVEDRHRIHAQYGLGQGPVILSLGHVHALRDRMELIHAMPQILSRYPDAHLLIVGDVSIRTPERWIAELGVEGKVVFTGAVPQEEVPAYLSAADIEAHWLVSVSGISLAGMEAMAAGLPVVTAEFPNKEEANGLVNYENIVTVPRNKPEAVVEAILRLLDNSDLRKKIGHKGQCYIIERFSWDRVCSETEELYRSLIVTAPKTD
jgi:glycosyltransferase involved in cell wall biosynthesis